MKVVVAVNILITNALDIRIRQWWRTMNVCFVPIYYITTLVSIHVNKFCSFFIFSSVLFALFVHISAIFSVNTFVYEGDNGRCTSLCSTTFSCCCCASLNELMASSSCFCPSVYELMATFSISSFLESLYCAYSIFACFSVAFAKLNFSTLSERQLIILVRLSIVCNNFIILKIKEKGIIFFTY